MEKKIFYTITSRRTVQLKIKRSDFICCLAPAQELEQAKAFISQISKENKTATHNCWAYIIGANAEVFHCSDAGEPSGTAGKPMLNMLQSYELTQVAAVVTRYFGGVKLGVRGLIDAYGQAVAQAIESAPLSRLVATQSYLIKVPYGYNDTLLHQLGTFKGRIVSTQYLEHVCHDYRVEEEDILKADDLLNSLLGGRHLIDVKKK